MLVSQFAQSSHYSHVFGSSTELHLIMHTFTRLHLYMDMLHITFHRKQCVVMQESNETESRGVTHSAAQPKVLCTTLHDRLFVVQLFIHTVLFLDLIAFICESVTKAVRQGLLG